MSCLTEFQIQKFRIALSILAEGLKPTEIVASEIITSTIESSEIGKKAPIPLIEPLSTQHKSNTFADQKVCDYFTHLPWLNPRQLSKHTTAGDELSLKLSPGKGQKTERVSQQRLSGEYFQGLPWSETLSAEDELVSIEVDSFPLKNCAFYALASHSFFHNLPWLKAIDIDDQLVTCAEGSTILEHRQTTASLACDAYFYGLPWSTNLSDFTDEPNGVFFQSLPWSSMAPTNAQSMTVGSSLHITPGSQSNSAVAAIGASNNIILAATESALHTAAKSATTSNMLTTTKKFFQSVPWDGDTHGSR